MIKKEKGYENIFKLPKGWTQSRIDEIIDKISIINKKLKKRNYKPDGKFPVIDQGKKFIGGFTNKRELIIDYNLPVILFGDHTKVLKYIDFNFVAGADGVKIIKPLEIFLPKIFYYFLQVVQLPDKGYARHFQFLSKSFIYIPPLPEQYRIVAKIEELFTKLDAGVKLLKKVKKQLKLYRQSVLKHALEGKLTEEWREAHKDELEPASILLERIKEEHKKSIKDKRRKYKKLLILNTSNLPKLPDGWRWIRLGEITVDIEKINPRDNPEMEFIYLDIASIDNDQQKITNSKKYLGKNAPSRARQLIKANDILFSTVRTYLINIAMVDNTFEGQIASTGFCIIRPYNPVNKKFIFYLVRTDFFLNPLTQIQRGTSYPAVRNSDVLDQFLPLPPLYEQHKIVEEIEQGFSIADEIEKVVDKNLKLTERLRQSILKRAFEGKLVPQDPNDESASILLEKIKKEKVRIEDEKKVRKGNKKKKS